MSDLYLDFRHDPNTHRVVDADSYNQTTYIPPVLVHHSQNFLFDAHSSNVVADPYGTYLYPASTSFRSSITENTTGQSSIDHQWMPSGIANIGWPLEPSQPLRSSPYLFSGGDSLPAVASSSSPLEEIAPSSSSHLPKVESESYLSTHDDIPKPRSPPPRPKNTRKKVHVKLADDQPATTMGKRRERVFIACRQCRERKIRCSGETPSCHYCKNRPQRASECQYDQEPRRRGRDKKPGTRQRIASSVEAKFHEQARPERRRRNRKGEDQWTTSEGPHNPPVSHRRSITPTATMASVRTPTSAPTFDDIAYLSEEALSDWRNSGSSRGSSRIVSLSTDPYHSGHGVDAPVIPISNLGQSTMQDKSAAATTQGFGVVYPTAIVEFHWREKGFPDPCSSFAEFLSQDLLFDVLNRTSSSSFAFRIIGG